MKVLIIDGQGGGLGRQLVVAVKERFPEIEVLAVGANSHSYRCHVSVPGRIWRLREKMPCWWHRGEQM